MSYMFAKVQPAVKKETRKVAVGTFVCVVFMWVVFGVGHLINPQTIPFDYTVFLAGAGGGVIAVLNFFLMGLTVQQVVSVQEEKQAAAKMKISYSRRMLFQVLWCILVLSFPCFQFAAGLFPLLFPNLVIKAVGIFGKEKEVEANGN